MYYTKSMVDLLRNIGEEGTQVFCHYLDNYYDTLEEPEFKDYQLAKIWHYLIVSGLTHEITNRGTHHKLAKQQLAKILNVNIAHYRYLDDDTRDYKLLTIKNYEDRKNYQKNWQRENKEKNQ